MLAACLAVGSSTTFWGESAIMNGLFKERLLTVYLIVGAGGSCSTHITLPHRQAVKARRIAAWAGFAMAAIRRVDVTLNLIVRAVSRIGTIIWPFLGRLCLTQGLGVESLYVVAITVRVLAAIRPLCWGRDWRSNWFRS